ncbi:MAG: tryptophan-rich sensory protein [Candidatus Gastranaerophilales bacterium]|nr:tryptophan-rich sensory protein [Candidatus Gastranaerophilales bacterium]
MFNTSWYLNLQKPLFSPPNWLFAPVWSVLYLCIFTSLAIYIMAQGENKKSGYILFVLQMLLNILWAPVFFGFKSLLGALIVVILLDIFVFLTMVKFFKISKIAGSLLLPYFIWILYATYLNIFYFILN